MAPSLCDPVVTRAWACTPPLQKGLAEAFVAAALTPTPWLDADAVDGLFFSVYGIAGLIYVRAWRGNWNVAEIEVVIEEVPVRTYAAQGLWVVELALALADPDSCLDERTCTYGKPYP